MDDAQKLKAIQVILTVHITNVEDEEGDKYLSDSNLAIEAIDEVASNGTMEHALRDHFITREMKEHGFDDEETATRDDYFDAESEGDNVVD